MTSLPPDPRQPSDANVSAEQVERLTADVAAYLAASLDDQTIERPGPGGHVRESSATSTEKAAESVEFVESVEAKEASQQVCRSGFVTHTHDTGQGQHIFCVVSCDCGHPTGLPVLFNDDALVTLTLEAPDENDPRGAVDPHPRITVHVNPGDDYSHDDCFTFDTCGVCFGPAFEAAFKDGGARLGVHAFDDENQVMVTPFRYDNWRSTREALATVRGRLTQS